MAVQLPKNANLFWGACVLFLLHFWPNSAFGANANKGDEKLTESSVDGLVRLINSSASSISKLQDKKSLAGVERIGFLFQDRSGKEILSAFEAREIVGTGLSKAKVVLTLPEEPCGIFLVLDVFPFSIERTPMLVWVLSVYRTVQIDLKSQDPSISLEPHPKRHGFDLLIWKHFEIQVLADHFNRQDCEKFCKKMIDALILAFQGEKK